MDFRTICQKLDVDHIRAKLPPLPALPHIKLPKAIPKLKSRKIFRSSREDVNRNSPQKLSGQQSQAMGSQMQLPPPIPHAGFIKHTPTRISTISSLMHEDSADGSTYLSAGSVDDDYPLPSYYGGGSSSSSAMRRPISPVRAATVGADGKDIAPTGSTTHIKMTLSQRLHRSYKDLSEFRFKHIFTKKTVVRKDSIRVDHYVPHYEEDLRREAQEQERHDRDIAENYTFRFKESRQNLDHSNSVTPDDSPRSQRIIGRTGVRTVGELSGDESGMEATPPPRKPGIAATRFAKVCSPPLRQSSSEQQSECEDEKIIIPPPEPNESTVWSIQKQKQQQHTSNETIQPDEEKSQISKTKHRYKESMRRFAMYMSTQEDSDAPETTTHTENTRGSTKMLSKLKGLGKRTADSEAVKQHKHPSSPRSSDEELPTAAQAHDGAAGSPPIPGNTFNTIKHNFKRLQQSIKSRSRHTATTDESGDESATQKSNAPSKVERLTTRLRRFRSRDVSIDNLDAEDETTTNQQPKETQSPIRQIITRQLENWKKSIKKHPNKPDDEAQPSDAAETSPEKDKPERQKRSDTLIKKLRHIRARKSIDAKDEEAEHPNTDGETPADDVHKTKSRATRFNEARQRTFKKVNEKMHHMKLFHKSQEQHEPPKLSNENKYHSEEEDWDESSQHEQANQFNLPPTITRRDFPPSNEYSPRQESIERMAISSNRFCIPAARAAWTTKPISSQSMESDIDPSELPRVLIHQDNSDSFESTLIIAVTRPLITTSPIITEIENDKHVPAESQRYETFQKSTQKDWVPNKKIIADFMEAAPPSTQNSRKQSKEAVPPLSGHKRKLSIDSSSNSDSDSWMPENKGSKTTTSRRGSQTGLISIDEKNEAWKVKRAATTNAENQSPPLYKTKSIDIFEKNVLKGGVLTAFEDFDEELRNEPVLKIKTMRNNNSCERESSEDTADDDNSSRITKISVARLKADSTEVVITTIDSKEKESCCAETVREKILLQYGNSRESLIANFDENEEDEGEGEVDDEDDDDDDDDDRPPSAAPSPPPKMSPPPPPLPQRKPSIRGVKKPTDSPPPLPKSKPPRLPPPVTKRQVVPPRIPERTASMPRAPKPLVKTSSLRLVYSEQVKPADIGKVNKLISQFEPTEGNKTQRPRVIPRRIQQDDSEDYTDDEEDYATMVDKLKERYANIKIERDTTPTPTNTPEQSTPKAKESPPQKPIIQMDSKDLSIRIKRELIVPMVVTTTDEDNNVQILSQPVDMKPSSIIDISSDTNSNHSQANSEYGSPLEYPSSLRSSLETIPTTLERRDANGQRLRSGDRHFGRSRRSMTRDDENFYSFDSDEENSYYSISSTGSNRYIVEL